MLEYLHNFPVIAAAKDADGLEKAIKSQSNVIFLLFGDVCNIIQLVKKIKSAGKQAIVHIDLIDGLSGREVCVKFIKNNTEADGIISTKTSVIRIARELGFITVQRFFLIDSRAFENTVKSVVQNKSDFIEILPGCMPKIIKKITSMVSVPVIAGGMIYDKEDIISALGSGSVAVSTTSPNLWDE